MQNQADFKLKLDWKPGAYHYHTVRKSISQSLWRKMRRRVLDNENNSCSTCGYTPSTSNLRQLHLHEIENYSEPNESELICTLKGLNLICQKCHAFHHWGRTTSVLSSDQINELIEHFMLVNQCNKADFLEHLRCVREDKMKQTLDHQEQLLKSQNNNMNSKEVKFRIDGDIPYKDEVIAQLKKKGLYVGA